ATAWCILPAFFQNIAPRLVPRVWQWIRPCNDWLLASSPNSLAETLLRSGVGPRLIDSIMWMIGLQLSAGSLMVLFSVARLRRASRAAREAGGNDRVLFAWWRARQWRLFRRPPCGTDPVLWKELHTFRQFGFVERLGVLVALGVVGLIGFGTYHFG